MKQKITIQKITSKQGQSSRTGKVFTKYGIQDQSGVWYNSFNPIQAVEGGEYDIEYETTQYGNDLKSISAVSVTENQTANTNRQNSIIRQHSQEMALRYFQIKGIEFTDEDLIKRIDWFVEDADTEIPF